ncbi:TetR/AcrR family transcriptional regulator [Cellulomonas cellasea]|uniref:TetR/AcrR family transcriptional regulator n=1 Tax=Cellulomonas cellasea TaxID=43670 RepID=UPI0025A3A9C8|nr:TetR/AcrR family transcriptional regulator [Cellulomonas cellasea]MDM8086101.1 TetR/AcrR family transcriptional regulator [Cellulomonas cellasea]
MTTREPEDDAAAAPPRRRGRPRDPELEDRALRATLDVYGEKGWSGLTIDEVASRSRVGKSSVYLRWPDKEKLLTSALRRIQGGDELTAPTAAPDDQDAEPSPPPSLRDYLITHANERAELYLGPYGLAMLRLYVESRAYPEVFSDIRREAITDFVLSQRRRVEAAVQSGELPPGASAIQLLDAVEGSVLMHVLVTPPHLVDRVRQTVPRYIEEMVDRQLAAEGYARRAPESPGAPVEPDLTPPGS